MQGKGPKLSARLYSSLLDQTLVRKTTTACATHAGFERAGDLDAARAVRVEMQAAGLGARRPAAAPPAYKAPAFLDAYARRHGKQARTGATAWARTLMCCPPPRMHVHAHLARCTGVASMRTQAQHQGRLACLSACAPGRVCMRARHAAARRALCQAMLAVLLAGCQCAGTQRHGRNDGDLRACTPALSRQALPGHRLSSKHPAVLRQGPGDPAMETPFAHTSPFALQQCLEAAQAADAAAGWGSPGGGASPPGSVCVERGPWMGRGGSLYGSPQRRRSTPVPMAAGGHGADAWAARGWPLPGDESTLELRREMLHSRHAPLSAL